MTPWNNRHRHLCGHSSVYTLYIALDNYFRYFRLWPVFPPGLGGERWVKMVESSTSPLISFTLSSRLHKKGVKMLGNGGTIYMNRIILIYIMITKDIRYLLWNRGFWCSLTLCIRCTNHLCDSCDLTDVNPNFIPSLLRMIQNVDLYCDDRYKSRSPAVVTSQWPIVPAWLLGTLS